MRRIRFSLRHLVFAARLSVLATCALFVASFVKNRGELRDVLGHQYMPDFIAHYTGGHMVNAPVEQLYSPRAQGVYELSLTHDPTFLNLFISPPYVAPLYAPFAWLSPSHAMIAWAIVSLLALTAAYLLLLPVIGRVKSSHLKLFVLCAFAFQPMQEVFGSGQDTPITILVWAAGIRLALEGRNGAAGLAFGMGALKPQLFVMPFLYFAGKRSWRAIAGMGATAVAWAAIGLAKYGIEGFRAWTWILRSPEYLEQIRRGRIWKMHSIVAFVEGMTPDTLERGARIVGFGLSAVLALATVFVALRTRSQRHAWALLAIAAVLVSPHLFSYDLALLTVSMFLLLGERWSPALRRAALANAMLLWMSAPRARMFGDYAWPISMLSASITAPAMYFVWKAVADRALQMREATLIAEAVAE